MAESTTPPAFNLPCSIGFLKELGAKNAAFPVLDQPDHKLDKHAIYPFWTKDKTGKKLMATGGELALYLDAGEEGTGKHAIGIIPGRLGCIVIDIDKPKASGNPSVAEAAEFVERILGKPMVAYETRGGGLHYWYRAGSLTKKGRGNGDLYMDDKHFGERRCDNGYVIAWNIEKLEGGLFYGWGSAKPVNQDALAKMLKPEGGNSNVVDMRSHLTPASAPEGQRRDTLNKCAFFDFKASRTPGEAAHAAINNIADALENPDPLPRDEVLKTVREAAKDCLGEAASGSFNLIDIREAEAKPIRWLWHEHIPEGEITVLAGKGGAGKSTLALTFAAIVASGSTWPDESEAKRGRVVILSTEDDVHKVQVPRCRAALQARDAEARAMPIETETWERSSSIAEAILPLLQHLEEAGEPPALLIIDPLIEIMGGGNSNAANDVRKCLHPIQLFAARTGTAVLGITHLAKYSNEADAVERVLGSSAWTAKPRALLLAHYDAQGGDARKLVRAKSNLGPNHGGYEYGLVLDAQARLTVEFGEALTGDADKLTAPKTGGLTAEEIEEGDRHFDRLKALYAKPDAQRPDWALFSASAFTDATRWDTRKTKKYRDLKGCVSVKAGKPFTGHWWTETPDEDS